MIVGTSTGALIAFALTGGRFEDGERKTMDCDEIIEMYKKLSPMIFPKGGIVQRLASFIKRKLMPCLPNMQEYDSANLISELHKYFQNSTLSDFPEGCIAGTENPSNYMISFPSYKPSPWIR